MRACVSVRVCVCAFQYLLFSCVRCRHDTLIPMSFALLVCPERTAAVCRDKGMDQLISVLYPVDSADEQQQEQLLKQAPNSRMSVMCPRRSHPTSLSV